MELVEMGLNVLEYTAVTTVNVEIKDLSKNYITVIRVSNDTANCNEAVKTLHFSESVPIKENEHKCYSAVR